jgi:transcriptional regulator with XRE-family HTH domain
MARPVYDNDEKFFKKLGARIKELRLERGKTQEDMMSCFPLRFYQRIEAGKSIHMKTALKVCNAFGITLEKLFKDL